jgi:hypothetical protein
MKLFAVHIAESSDARKSAIRAQYSRQLASFFQCSGSIVGAFRVFQGFGTGVHDFSD